MEMAEGLTDKLKSGGGGGPDEPPPQLTTKNTMTDAKQPRATKLLERLNILFVASIPASLTHWLLRGIIGRNVEAT
jgi:hypothetical protein